MNSRRELFRQLIHIMGIIFVFLSQFLGAPLMILISISAAILGEIIFQIDRKRHIPFFSTILRSCRRNRAERGFIYFFLGMALTYSLFGFNMAIANASIMVLTLGDSLSTLVGRRYGRHPLPGNPDKSFEGSLAFIIAASLGSVLFIEPLYAVIAAVTGGLVEAYTPLEDNITVPLFTGIILVMFQFLT